MSNGRRNNNPRRSGRTRKSAAARRLAKPTPMNVTNNMRYKTNGNGLSNRGAIRRPMVNKSFIERGSDFLGPLTVKAGNNINSASDRILLSNSISPSSYAGTRLTQLAPLWERYRFRKFKIRWVPAVPKTIACQLIIYQDTDPLDNPGTITNPDALIRQATAQAGSQQFNFINPMSIELAKRADDQLYYTGPVRENERFSQQGNFYVIQVTDPLDFNGTPINQDIMAGSLYVDWEIDFQIAQIEPSLFSPPAEIIVLSQVSGYRYNGPEAEVALTAYTITSGGNSGFDVNINGTDFATLSFNGNFTTIPATVTDGDIIALVAAGQPDVYGSVIGFKPIGFGTPTLTPL